jgi:hypothetical protein
MLIKKFVFATLLLGFWGLAAAQVSPVREMDKTMSFGTRPAFYIEFVGASSGLVEDEWKKFAKERFGAKLKKDKKSSEWFAADVTNSNISPNKFTLRSVVEKMGKDGATISVWFDLGSAFLGRREYPQSADEVNRILSDFYIQVRKVVVTEEIKAAEKKLKDLESDKRKLEKDNDGLHKDIENYKAKIKKAEDDIVKNEQSQNLNVADQEAQRRMIEAIRLRLQNIESERGGN